MFQLLLVDDETSVVDSLADTLPWQDIGITRVFKAYSGLEALDILRTNPVDILMTDVRMPGMNGLELLETVQRNWKKVKCVLLSGHAEFDYAQQAIRQNVYEYLLKPVRDDYMLQRVKRIVDLLEAENLEQQAQVRAVKTLQENLPKIRGDLLNDLLSGRRIAPERLQEKLELLKVRAMYGDSFALMLVRLEDTFTELDFYSLSLMEYAIGNMAEEIFEDSFRLWHCKDVHDYLVFLVAAENKAEAGGAPAAAGDSEDKVNRLEHLASYLQLSVKRYLKGAVSVLVSQWGNFPGDVQSLYQGLLTSLRWQVGNKNELFLSVTGEMEQLSSFRSLHSLYEPPLLVHLLESGSWDAIQDKLESFLQELEAKWSDSNEHLVEVFFHIYSAYSFFAHKNGISLAQMIGADLAAVGGLAPCRSLHSLHQWVFPVTQRLQAYMNTESQKERISVVRKMQDFVQKNLVSDVSLQAIADHLHMHPVYVSRVYKLETGENLSDYTFRLKMGKAATLLTDTDLKTYEIALQLGYKNPKYFIKVFKKYYSLPPQEFRIKQSESRQKQEGR